MQPRFGRRRSTLGLLLEDMQHEDEAGDPEGIDCAVGVTVIVFDDLQDTR